MVNSKGLLAKINVLLIWRIFLVLVISANVGFAIMLWMSGGKETVVAYESGRRFIYTLADGRLEGKEITSEELAKSLKPVNNPEPVFDNNIQPDTAAELPQEQKPTEPQTSENSQQENPAVTEQKIPESETAQPVAVAPLDPDAPAQVAADNETPLVENATPPEATSQEPVVELPVQPADGAQTGPIAPEPPVYNQPLPAVPADTSGVPAVLPDPAPSPPLSNQSPPAIKPSSQKLPDVNPLISEKTTEGTIPVVGQDGTKAWNYYAKPFADSGKQPMIAVIITGLGQNKLVTEHSLALNENFTLSFSPYAKDIDKWAASARLAGHEVMLDLPVEPTNFPAADPGPYGLLTSKPPEENEEKLRWLMSRITTSVGFVTPRNERYTASVEHVKLLLQSLANRGIMIVLARNTSKDEVAEVLENSTAENLVANFIIDEDMSEATIQAKLASMEQLAVKQGYAIGIAQSYPLTIAQLRAWSDTLSAKGILLVPVTAIAKKNFT